MRRTSRSAHASRSPEQVTPDERRAPRRALWTTLAIVLVLTTGVVAGERGLAWRDARQREDAREAAVRAAKAEVVGLISISAATTQKDIEALIDGATDSFRDDLRAQADRLREEVRTNRVEATGEVVSAAVVDLKGDEATLLLAARGTVSNRQAREPEPRSYRLQVSVKEVEGRWLVSALTFVA